MSDDRMDRRSRAHTWMRQNALGLAAIFIALNGTAIAASIAREDASSEPRVSGKLKAEAAAKGKRGPKGARGPAGPAGPPGPATGAAGGALVGSFPNPSLDVSGGPCPNGQELVNVTSTAALSCSAGVYSDADFNVAAGPTAFPSITSGQGNSALGSGALQQNDAGSHNSAFGNGALALNTEAIGNSAFGSQALQLNTTGQGNTAVGGFALDENTEGHSNSALGSDALSANTTGFQNTAVGGFALGGNNGNNNTGVGSSALPANDTGNGNTAIGTSSLFNNSTGSGNIAIGPLGGSALTTGNENIAIGNPGVAAEAQTTRIGNSQTRAFMAGIHGTTTGVADAIPVLIDSNGQLGTVSSSKRFKTGIEGLGSEADSVLDLKPVSFRYRSGPPELHYGLIAEQVDRVIPELVAYGPDGLPETVQYQELPALLLAVVRRQQAQIDRLMRRVGKN